MEITKIPSQDIVRSYRKRFPSLRKTTDTAIVLEALVDPQQQLDLARNKKANLVPAELLYQHGFWETSPKVYQHYSEELVKIYDDQVELDFLLKESQNKILQQGYPIIHVGLILIGIHGMHRKNYGLYIFNR